MRIVVRLVGESLPWRYRDIDRLGNWIDARPWTGPPTADVIRVTDQSAARRILLGVQDAIAAADRGATGVECASLEPAAVSAGGFMDAAAGYLGVSSARPLPDLAKAIVRGPADRPTVWLVPPLRGERPQLLHETEQFLDLLTKMFAAPRLGVVFTDTPASPLGGRAFDLTVGGPAVGTDLLTVPEPRLWPHYLHRRLAWESGGHLSRAEQFASAVEAARLRVGDEEGLEGVLNREARAAYADLDAATRAGITAGLEAYVGRGGRVGVAPEGFWSPGHLAGEAPVPWIARSLLQIGHQPFAELLRGSLLCLPISQELLMACFLMETHIRARIQLPVDPPETASCHEPWRSFTAGETLSATLYPPGCPATPTGPWAFASLGEILAHELDRPPGADWRRQVRELRNHLAHGHHVGWQAVRLARKLASRLAH